jgi:hypothetical protein
MQSPNHLNWSLILMAYLRAGTKVCERDGASVFALGSSREEKHGVATLFVVDEILSSVRGLCRI